MSPLTACSQAPVFPSPCSGSTAGPCSPDTSSPESARVAVREEMRSRFRGSRDLIHRLFVCISGAPSPQGGHGLGGTRWVGRLQAVAGVLRESPQKGWGAGPAQGLPHHVTSLPQAPRGAQPRGGRRASSGPPQCRGGSPGRAWGPSPPTREVLFNLMSRLILFPSVPWVRGTMTASFPGIQRGA